MLAGWLAESLAGWLAESLAGWLAGGVWMGEVKLLRVIGWAIRLLVSILGRVGFGLLKSGNANE